MRLIHIVCLSLAGLAAFNVSRALAHEEVVVIVGHNAAGKLKVHVHFDQPVELPASIFLGISGYADAEPAFHSTSLDEPEEDLFQLSTAADFCFILLAKDPGMEVRNDTSSGFMATNDAFRLGSAPFDNHPIWNIVNGIPGNTYSLTLKMRDVKGIYSDSAPFVLSFTPVQVLYPLNIKQLDPLQAALTWATNAVGWELQYAASITATNWVAITNVPAVSGTNFSLNIGTTESQQFFRLRMP